MPGVSYRFITVLLMSRTQVVHVFQLGGEDRLFAGEYLVIVCALPTPDNCGKTQTCRIICTAANWGRAQWREVFVAIRRKVFVNIGRKVFARIERATA